MNYIVIESHQSNYPDPITFTKGTKVKLGEKSDGYEGWENWIYCNTLDDNIQGWVPIQLLSIENEYGVALEDYTAKELNVEANELVEGIKELNGWLWCMNMSSGEKGWLPKEKLRKK